METKIGRTSARIGVVSCRVVVSPSAATEKKDRGVAAIASDRALGEDLLAARRTEVPLLARAPEVAREDAIDGSAAPQEKRSRERS